MNRHIDHVNTGALSQLEVLTVLLLHVSTAMLLLWLPTWQSGGNLVTTLAISLLT